MTDLRVLLRADLARYTRGRPSLIASVRILATDAGALAVLTHRLAHALWPHHSATSRLVRSLGVILTGADLSPQAVIGPGLKIAHPAGVVVGGGVRAGQDLTLFQGSTLGRRRPNEDDITDYPELGDCVTVSANAVVLGGIRVGDHSIIGAHSLVLSDVATGDSVAGVPARRLSSRNKKR